MDITGKIAVVTGASSGIGHALATGLLSEGARVIGIGLPDDPSVIDHPLFSWMDCDCSVSKEVHDTFDKVIRDHGTIDIYVANAGQARYTSAVLLPDKDIRMMTDLNMLSVMGAFRLMKRFHHDRPFAFVAISSVMAYWPLPGYAVYSATKAGVMAYIKGVRHELGKGQKAHLVYPVATSTRFFKVSGQRHPSPMIQTPEHVANTIIKGIRKGKEDIHTSRLFRIAHAIAPWALKPYVQSERKRLMSGKDE
jgi:uncharacterized protein